MFDDALLESSLSKSPVLKRIHWAISAAVGLLGFAATWRFLPDIAAQFEGRSPLSAAALAGLLCAGYVLMTLYVRADARRHRLRGWFWFPFALLFNIAGFLIYLLYSASKTGTWRRPAMLIGYILQGALCGALFVSQLI